MHMKKCVRSFIIFIICTILCTNIRVYAGENKGAVGEAKNIIDGIISFNTQKTDTTDVQNFIDDALTSRIGGTAEWYVLALSQYGDYDFSKYRAALEKYLSENDVKGASARLKFSLLLSIVGGDDSYITKCLTDDTVGGQGIMSYVFGLHLYNNGYSGVISKEEIIEKLKSLRHEDGGWSVTGNVGDVDVTAMTLTALAPLLPSKYASQVLEPGGLIRYVTDTDAETDNDPELDLSILLIDGIEFLAERQLEDGDFSSFGVRNAESTAQVIVALSALGIDCTKDERFIKNGHDPIDGILLYSLPDGSFVHKAGDESSGTATVQTFYSMVAYLRMAENLSPLYVKTGGERKLSELFGEPGTEKNIEKIDDKNGPDNNDNNITGHDNIADDNSEKSSVNESISESDKNDNYLKDNDSIGENADTGIDKNTGINAGINNNNGSNNNSIHRGDDNGIWNSYKIFAIIGILILSFILSLFFFLRKKHWKNYLFVGIVGLIGILIIIFTDFSSPEEYYGKSTEKSNVIGTVTMSIRCDILEGKKLNEHIPADYCILDTTEFELSEGESAYDILLEGAKKYSISVEHEGSSDIVYISGINYLYENDYGDLSGWVYKVNGVLPSVGCAGYTLKPGDKIEWCYTLDLGNDVLFDAS